MRDESRDSILPPPEDNDRVLLEIAADKELMQLVKTSCPLVNELVDKLEDLDWPAQMVVLYMMYASIAGRINAEYREQTMEQFVRNAHALTVMQDEISKMNGED